MSQADILSVLMFGRPTSELNNGQQASLQTQAAGIAGSYAANALGQQAADALGLQALQLSVENGMAAVGTYLTQDVFLSASQNVAPQTEQVPGQPSQKATIQITSRGVDPVSWSVFGREARRRAMPKTHPPYPPSIAGGWSNRCARGGR